MTMGTHTLEVHIPDDLLKQIDECARAQGGDRSELIIELIQKGLVSTHPPNAEMPFSDLLAYAAGNSPAHGLTDDELEEFAEAEVKAYRADKRLSAKIG